jgi:hypothetical protein
MTLFYRRVNTSTDCWLSFAVLAQGQPETEGHLERAQDAHQVRIICEEAGDSADTVGAELPKERVFSGLDQLDHPVTYCDDRERLLHPTDPHVAPPY